MKTENSISFYKYKGDEYVCITRKCPVCNEEWNYIFSKGQFKSIQEWQEGCQRIQEVLIDFTPDEREFLISGICENCFKKMEIEE